MTLAYVQATEIVPPWDLDSIPPEVRPEGEEIGFRSESAWDFIQSMVGRVAEYFFILGVIVAPLVVLVAVFMIFTAGGDPAKMQSAKKLIFWTIIVLGIIVLARVAISAIRYIVSFR